MHLPLKETILGAHPSQFTMKCNVCNKKATWSFGKYTLCKKHLYLNKKLLKIYTNGLEIMLDAINNGTWHVGNKIGKYKLVLD